MSAYPKLEARFRRIGLFGDLRGILNWDSETMMPVGSADTRAEQTAELDLLLHDLTTDPAVGELLAKAESESGLDDWQQANLAEMRRAYLHATAVPADLVAALSRAVSACEIAWRGARPANDFAGLLPKLQEVLDLTRESGQAKAHKLNCSLYDALLDQYEPGMQSAEIDRIFAELGAFLPELIGRVLEHQASQPAPLPFEGPFPIPAQRELGLKFMAALGFEFDRGRLDISAHPFSGGATDDVRITTRYSEEDFGRALMGVLHETGHALYELGLPPAWRHQPVGSARGMALHESQSLLVEMQACRSRAFAEFSAPLIREAFGVSGPAYEPDNIYRAGIRVSRGFIRVDADEVTYPAHVVLRYRLERALLGGDVSLAELPGAWADLMQELVGIRPPDHRQGCLQDIHWPGGAWGYFPTYTLGAMIAAQLFQTAVEATPAIPQGIEKGDFSGLLGWLRRNVHAKASRYSTRDVLCQATGRPLDVGVFRAHLERRYLS
jgi:carboxypeptidase Taq